MVPDPLNQPAPSLSKAGSSRTETERALASVWAEVLGLPSVDPQDNFVELGGDSLKAIRVMAEASKLGITFPLNRILATRSLAELTASVGASSLSSRHSEGSILPLTPTQRWFLELSGGAQTNWDVEVLLEANRPLDASLLKQALGAVQREHEALRLRLKLVDGEWTASVANDTGFSFQYVELDQLERRKQTARIVGVTEEVRAGLNLASGPLIGATLFGRGAARPSLISIVAHHFVFDAYSRWILIQDLGTAYEQLAQHDPIHIPPEITRYGHWARLISQAAQSDQVTSQLPYWMTQTGGNLRPLPIDLPNPRNLAIDAETVVSSLTVAETRRLTQLKAVRQGGSLAHVLLGALSQAYRRWTGERRLLVNILDHGRDDSLTGASLARTIGCTTHVYPLLLEVEPDASATEVLRTIAATVAEVPYHGIGYGLLRYVSSAPSIKERLRDPLTGIGFNFHGQSPSTAEFHAFSKTRGAPAQKLAPQVERTLPLDVDTGIQNGRLETKWTYSKRIHRRETIQQVAHWCLDSLRGFTETPPEAMHRGGSRLSRTHPQ